MQPSFFKNLGPIGIEKIQDTIKCQVQNVQKEQLFYGLKSIINTEENFLTFAYDNQSIETRNLLPTAIICTEKKAKEFRKDQMLIIVKDVQLTLSILSNIFYRDYTNEELKSLKDLKVGINCNLSKLATIER